MACAPIGDCFQTTRELVLAQVLPAAGAFTSQGFTSLTLGTKKIAFWIQYTRGAADALHFPALRVEWTDGTDVGRALILDTGSIAVVQPNATVNVDLEELLGPSPADGTALTYVLEYDVPAGATGVRLLAAERGVTASPGTISEALTTSGGC